jgi:hypothetical protein
MQCHQLQCHCLQETAWLQEAACLQESTLSVLPLRLLLGLQEDRTVLYSSTLTNLNTKTPNPDVWHVSACCTLTAAPSKPNALNLLHNTADSTIPYAKALCQAKLAICGSSATAANAM